ncbi:MAG: alpha-hydroxy-acid oxidizing protein [Luminiphilus sp.]|nr:alpha-hydroxy-acid oxidizing protein [Luminiphilus sp.]
MAAAGQEGVERALGNLKSEIERDMRLMGVSRVSELNRSNLRYR